MDDREEGVGEDLAGAVAGCVLDQLCVANPRVIGRGLYNWLTSPWGSEARAS